MSHVNLNTDLIDYSEHFLEKEKALLPGAAFAPNLDPNRRPFVVAGPVAAVGGLAAPDEFDHRFCDALEREPRRPMALVQVGLSAARFERVVLVLLPDAQPPLRFPVDMSPKPRLKPGEHLHQETRAETVSEFSLGLKPPQQITTAATFTHLALSWTPP